MMVNPDIDKPRYPSLIISVYRDTRALELIFDALKEQTWKNFEVVIAEDGEDIEMENVVSRLRQSVDFPVKHTTQPDQGVRKSHSQNRAVLASEGDYLIFIDGDCVPYRRFIENHLLLSEPMSLVSGRRVNLGPIFSRKMREGKLSPVELEKKFLPLLPFIWRDAKESHIEEGIQIQRGGLIHRFLSKRKRVPSLLGCNMSMYRDALFAINGFDESLGNSSKAGDFDIEWRLKGLGYTVVSGKYLVNQFHLYHERKPEDYDRGMMKIIQKNMENKQYICREGLLKSNAE